MSSNANPEVYSPHNEFLTSTGKSAACSGLRLRFLERIDLDPNRTAKDPVERGIDEEYGPIEAPASDLQEKWVYVFRRWGGGGVALKAEGQFDEEGNFKLVDWSSKNWAGKDKRPADPDPEVDGTPHLEVEYNPEKEDLFAFLSHVQLPRRRLSKYIGARPDISLDYRARELNPGQGKDYLVRNHEAGYDNVLLTDYVGCAFDLQRRYKRAVAARALYTQRHAPQTFSHRVTQVVKSGYERQKDETLEFLDDRLSAYSTPDGTGRHDQNLQALSEEVERRGDTLYGFWLNQPQYEEARDDGSDFGRSIDKLEKKQRKRVEDEVMRQTEFLDGASLCESGRDFLEDVLNQETSWLKMTAFSNKMFKDLTGVAKKHYEKATESSGGGSSSPSRAERRVRTQSILLEATQESTRTHMESGEKPTDVLPAEKIQAQLLEKVHKNVSSGGVVPKPGEEGFDKLVEEGLSSDTPTRSLPPESDIRAQQVEYVLNPDADRMSWGYSPPGETEFYNYNFALDRDRGLYLSTGDAAEEASASARAPDPAQAATEVELTKWQKHLEHRRALIREIDEELGMAGGAGTEKGEQDPDAALGQNKLNPNMRGRIYAGRFLGALGGVGAALALVKLSDRLSKGGAGKTAFEQWGGALGDVAGVVGGTAEAVEAGKYFRLTRRMFSRNVFAGAGAVGRFAGWVGVVYNGLKSGYELIWKHDAFGAASSGLMAVGGVMLISGGPFTKLFGLGIVLAGFIAASYADSKLEEALKTSYWSSEERGAFEMEEIQHPDPYIDGVFEGSEKTEPDPDLSSTLSEQMNGILNLLARPRMRVEIVDGDGRRVHYPTDRASQFEDPSPTSRPRHLRLAVTPGFMPGGGTLELHNFQIEGHEGVVLEETSGFPVPDPRYDIAVSRGTGEGSGTEYVRQWPVAALPEEAQRVLREAQPGGWRFSCEARVKIPDRTEESQGLDELDQAYDISGRVVCDITQEMTGERIPMSVEQSTTPIDPGDTEGKDSGSASSLPSLDAL